MAATHQAVQQHRVFLNAGHGLSNATASIYDTGATSPFGTEAYIARNVVEQVVTSYYLKSDETCPPLQVIETPECSDMCLTLHPRKWVDGKPIPSGHLAYLAGVPDPDRPHKFRFNGWINDVAKPNDILISVHLNESPDPKTSGVLVIIDNRAPVARHYEAEQIAKIVSGVLGIPNQGVLTDDKTPRHSIGIVQNTKIPAFLVEIGFVSNAGDVAAVEACGAEAIIKVIETLKGHK